MEQHKIGDILQDKDDAESRIEITQVREHGYSFKFVKDEFNRVYKTESVPLIYLRFVKQE